MPVFNSPRTAFGRGRPTVSSGVPAWMSSATVGALTQLPNSTGAGSSAVDAYSGWAMDDQLRIWILAAGGHQNSADNRVVVYDASLDTPTGWRVAKAASTPRVDSAYYADGTPTSRHSYFTTIWHAPTRRMFLIGCYGAYTNLSPLSFNTIDGWNVDTEQWDAAGTWPYTNGTTLNSGGGAYQWGACIDKANGNLFFGADGVSSVNMWTPGQSTFTNKGTTVDNTVRSPRAWDSSRSAIFGVMYGNDQGGGTPGITAVQTLNPSSGSPTKRSISFNTVGASGTALNTFTSDAPMYIGMDYDALRDKFFGVYNTSPNVDAAARYIEITPNSGTTWDMAVITPTGNAGLVSQNGMNARVSYVQRGGIGGFLLMTKAANGVYFYRTT